MTINLALEYIPRKMQELGYGNNYHLRMRHITVLPEENTTIESYSGEFFLLVEDYPMAIVESETGLYDLEADSANEMQYEHQGEITITNKSENDFLQIKFIQVIPKHITPQCKTDKAY